MPTWKGMLATHLSKTGSGCFRKSPLTHVNLLASPLHSASCACQEKRPGSRAHVHTHTHTIHNHFRTKSHVQGVNSCQDCLV